MEHSKNFNFVLPSSNGNGPADINLISDNFRNIDANAIKREPGKGLSTNDFTNEEKEKLANALLPENIDQTYNPTNENAQSGIAVAEALTTIVKDLEPIPNGTVDEWEYNKFYKNITLEKMVIYKYVFDDGTFDFIGTLLPVSIVVKYKKMTSDPTASYRDVIYNFDGKQAIEIEIDPFNKTINKNSFIPIDKSQAATEINETSNNNQYPTALAVKNYVNTSIDQTYSSESTNAQSGIAVAEAVKQGDKWELINTIALTSDVVSMMFDKDSNGNPFTLKSFYIKCKIGVQTPASAKLYLTASALESSSLYGLKSPEAIGSLSQTPRTWGCGMNGCFAFYEKTTIASTVDYPNSNVPNCVVSSIPPYNSLITKGVKRIALSAVKSGITDFDNIVAGSTFELWGVRK